MKIVRCLEDEFDPRWVEGVFDPEVMRALYHRIEHPYKLLASSFDELMQRAIDAAETVAISGPFAHKTPGGPFGAAAFIPDLLVDPNDGKLVQFRKWWPRLDHPERTELPVESVKQWRIVALSANVVEPCGDPSAHAEIVALRLASAVSGRNGWKHFMGLATTGSPCAMCAGALHWWRPRWIIAGATLADAISNGFHEGLDPRLVDLIRKGMDLSPENEAWVQHQRDLGAFVARAVCREEVISRLYRPYFGELNRTLYNSGPDDPSG